MNVKRFAIAAVVVFLVRTILNAVFYGYLMHSTYEAMAAAHPGVLREVVPAYVALDLLAALVFTYLFAKAGAAFGGGVKGGLALGLIFAILAPVSWTLYWYFGITFYTSSFLATELVFQVVSHLLQGATAGALYRAA
jgi:hypothetical protein